MMSEGLHKFMLAWVEYNAVLTFVTFVWSLVITIKYWSDLVTANQ